MMLNYLEEEKAAAKIQAALVLFLSEKKHLTPDLGGKATTDEMVDGIIRKIMLLR